MLLAKPNKKLLFKIGRLRCFRLVKTPKRENTKIFFECGSEIIDLTEFNRVASIGVFYFGIGRLVFVFFFGKRNYNNVIRFKKKP